jgi:hypothetical protein
MRYYIEHTVSIYQGIGYYIEHAMSILQSIRLLY